MYIPPVTPAEAHAVYALVRVTPAEIRLERIYNELYFGSTVLHLVVRLLFLALGLSVSCRNLSNRAAQGLLKLLRRGPQEKRVADVTLFLSGYVYYLVYAATFTVFWSPLSFYESFVLPHRYGLSHEPAGLWLMDLAKDSVVSAVIGGFFAAAAVCVIAAYPRRWAAVCAWWSSPIIFVGIFFNPLLDRVDNRFTRLPQSSALYAPLHALAARAGVPDVVIFVADKSRQTDETNAYVTGLGSSAQIVLWDTTIKKMKPDEVVAITGHELGHYVEHHVLIGGALAALSMFLFLPLIKVVSEAILQKFGRSWRISSLADPAALPILIVALSVISFLASPITNAVSRVFEHRADSFGLAVTGNRIAMATAQVDLANENLSNPYPPKWEIVWLEDHPPFGERIRFALYGQPINGPAASTRRH